MTERGFICQGILESNILLIQVRTRSEKDIQLLLSEIFIIQILIYEPFNYSVQLFEYKSVVY